MQAYEKVDKAAKQATHLPSISDSLIPENSDLFMYINNVIRQLWFIKWGNLHTQGDKLAQIKQTSTQ